MHTGVLDTVRQSCSFSNLGARPWLQPACSNHRQPCAREQRSVRVAGFGDELLDFLQAGPKLRRWYGEGERLTEEEFLEEPERTDDVPEPAAPSQRDCVLVSDADSPMGEQVILQLILARAQVKALVRNAQATRNAFGSYVEAVEASIDDNVALQQALADVRAVICPGKLGGLLGAARAQRVPHVVLLASAGTGTEQGLFGSMLMGAEARILADRAREQAVRQSGISHTIVRVGSITASPGQLSELSFTQELDDPGSISREDAAAVLAQSVLYGSPSSQLSFQVAALGDGAPPDWARVFEQLHASPQTHGR